MIGVNTFCFRREMGSNAGEIIKKLHELGFEALEPFVYSEGALAAVKAETDKYGMKIPSIHLVFYGMEPTVENLSPYLKKLHREYGVEAFVVSGHIQDAAGAEHWAALLKALGENLKSEGCTMVFHNHDSEIRTIDVNGKQMTGLEYFFSLAGEEVLLQLDIGWAGLYAPELEVAKRYKDRIHSLHLKDFYPGYRGKYTCHNIPVESFCPIGCGEIQNREFVEMRDEMSRFSGLIILDQDNSAGDLMEDLAVGIQNIRSWL